MRQQQVPSDLRVFTQRIEITISSCAGVSSASLTSSKTPEVQHALHLLVHAGFFFLVSEVSRLAELPELPEQGMLEALFKCQLILALVYGNRNLKCLFCRDGRHTQVKHTHGIVRGPKA